VVIVVVLRGRYRDALHITPFLPRCRHIDTQKPRVAIGSVMVSIAGEAVRDGAIVHLSGGPDWCAEHRMAGSKTALFGGM